MGTHAKAPLNGDGLLRLIFSAKAGNARLSAACLVAATTRRGTYRPSRVRWDLTSHPPIAYHEAFLREASVALELIIKAG